jgi:hypothetical protein
MYIFWQSTTRLVRPKRATDRYTLRETARGARWEGYNDATAATCL